MFCKKCGTKLDDGSLFCGKCGTKLDEGNKFCRKCGTLQATGENRVLNSSSPVIEEAEDHGWDFKCTTGLIYQFTSIKAKGSLLSVKQGNSILGLIPYGIDTKQIDIKDIFSISEGKRVSLKGVLLIMAGIVGAAKEQLAMLLLAAVGVWLLFDKVMDIQHKTGEICIYNSIKIGNDRSNFLNYVRQFNPNCIKIPME